MEHKIPITVLKRLPAYEEYLIMLHSNGVVRVSSTDVAKALELGEVSVRKDFALLAGEGRPHCGRDVTQLLECIEKTLDNKNQKAAILVGAGKLGRALMDYPGFDRYGLKIAAAFDLHPERKREFYHGEIPILPLEQMNTFCRENKILMGIITVPAAAAQEIAQLLVENGIRAIWNFAPTHLTLPPQIILHNENMAGSLAALSHLLSLQECEKSAKKEK